MFTGRSFRDPDGFCLEHDHRILRVVRPHAADHIRELVSSPRFQAWVDEGYIPDTRIVDDPELSKLLLDGNGSNGTPPTQWPVILEQRRIAFVSYPHEWCPEMLYAAAELTLELQADALEQGWMLKDATPLNVLFDGPRPVFVDVLSIVRRPRGSSVWPAYAQFIRTFILPLLLNRQQGGGTHEVFGTRRDGLEPEEVYDRLSRVKRLQGPALTCVSIPTWLGRTKAAKTVAPSRVRPVPEERAAAVTRLMLKSLKRTLSRVKPRRRNSSWSQYTSTNTYEAAATSAKQHFVAKLLRQWRAQTILDVGCNTGQFSKVACGTGASVVAIDYDPTVVGHVFAAATADGARILPLVVNLSRPSPALGWANGELASFLSRAEHAFDAALLLAVIHHLAVTDGAPLAEIFRLIRSLVRKGAIVEFVPPSDPQFERIARNKEHLIATLQQSDFEQALRPWFEVTDRLPLPGSGRVLYALDAR